MGDTQVEVVDLVAATLRRVATEAERLAGGPVEDVRLVVPAGWGPRRRTWMRQVAHRAGLPQPRLVEAPVAVAEHLLATGVQMRVGSFIVVCDVGGEAEVTVLRRGPAGFEVLATLADPAAGGTAIDHTLTAIASHDPAPAPARPQVPRQATCSGTTSTPGVTAAAVPKRLTLRVLGEPALLVDGASVPVRRTAALQAIVYLALHA